MNKPTKAQLPGEDATYDCISRQGLKENLLSEDYETHDYCFPCKEIMKRIDEQPSEQPDIIVCGDCKYWICHDRRCGYWNHGIKPLDWCSYAERKEGEAE